MKEEGTGRQSWGGSWSSVPCQDGLYTVMRKGRRWGLNEKKKNILWETRWRWLWLRWQQWGWQSLATMCLCMHVHKCACHAMSVMSHALGSAIVISSTCFLENFPRSHSREVKAMITALHYIPLQLQWELIALSFNDVKSGSAAFSKVLFLIIYSLRVLSDVKANSCFLIW